MVFELKEEGKVRLQINLSNVGVIGSYKLPLFEFEAEILR